MNFGHLIRLARPKFLWYSLVCQLVGTLWYDVVASEKGSGGVDWKLFAIMQGTIWATHLSTHYWNEYADVECDRLNKNAGSWTGGSKVLAKGLLPPVVALIGGFIMLTLAIVGGVATVWYYLKDVRGIISPEVSLLNDILFQSGGGGFKLFVDLLFHQAFPWEFVLLGLSVLVVALAYSLPPFHLAANSLGELAVSYVLAFATPAVGLLSQGGEITLEFIQLIVPLFLINTARMMVMNVPDRAGDAAGGKITSIVLLGERKAIILHNLLTVLTFFVVIPLLNLPDTVRIAYYCLLPFRWWQSLRLNVDEWWLGDGVNKKKLGKEVKNLNRRELADSIPFVESLFVLATAVAISTGLIIQ